MSKACKLVALVVFVLAALSGLGSPVLTGASWYLLIAIGLAFSTAAEIV